MTNTEIKVGTRGSSLALRQTDLVLTLLQPYFPELTFQTVIIRTHGDSNPTASLTGLGQGIFVKEIEQQLISQDLDMAVHSLKDLPTLLPEGLAIGAILDREDPRDVLINRWHCTFDDLPDGARIGTSSPRRVAQIKESNPLLNVLPIRGNVETRLSKSNSDDYDGVVLAAAGLQRLGLDNQISEYLPLKKFVPPPGQGVLAVEIRNDNANIKRILSHLNEPLISAATTSERLFLELLGGGCQLPVGAYAQSSGEDLVLDVFMSTSDGDAIFRGNQSGPRTRPEDLARAAYSDLLEHADTKLITALTI